MTVKKLIEMLLKYDLDDKVLAWDADAEQLQAITGVVYCPDTHTIEIQTDVDP